MSITPAHKLRLVQRRQQAAELLLQGWTQEAIAGKLGVRPSTIGADLQQVRRTWRQSAIRDFDALQAQELAAIDLVKREAWAGFVRSQQPAQSATTDGPAGRQASRRTIRNQHGDPHFLLIVLKCIEDRQKRVGRAAAEKIAPPTPDGPPLTNQQRQALIEAILAEKFSCEPDVALPSTIPPEVTDETGTSAPHAGPTDGC